jgi:hypothetical protein
LFTADGLGHQLMDGVSDEGACDAGFGVAARPVVEHGAGVLNGRGRVG